MKMHFAWVPLLLLGTLHAESARSETIGERVARKADVGDAVRAVGKDSFANISVDFPGGVQGMPSVTYQTLPGYRPMTLDLFLPPESFRRKEPRPWVMYIHGGGWVMGGPRRSAAYRDWPKVLASLAAEGYVVASVSYRFAREAPFPAAIQDVKAAIRWLKANAAQYHLDPDRGMTMGQSAGGHLAALAAVSCGVEAFEPPPRSVPDAPNVETTASSPEGADKVSDCVQGAVAWFGIYDFATAYKPSNATTAVPNVTDLFLACDNGPCREDQLKYASPINYVDSKDPPILLMHGTDDRTVDATQSKEFEAALRAAGVPTRLIMMPGVGHSWIGQTPDMTRSTSKRALQLSIDFIEATIGDSAKGR